MFKKAEFHLILVVILCVSIIFFFKGKTISRFNEFDKNLNDFLINSITTSSSVFFSTFEKDFEALIFLDKDLKQQTEKLKKLAISDENFKTLKRCHLATKQSCKIILHAIKNVLI